MSRVQSENLLRDATVIGVDGKATIQVHVPAMSCGGCMRKIERELNAVPGIFSARANLTSKTVTIHWDPAPLDVMTVSQTLTELGYEHVPYTQFADQSDVQDATSRHLLMCVAVAGFAAANIMLLSVSVWSGADAETRQLFHLISGLIALPAVAFAGRPFFRSAFNSLRHRRLNMDVPISLAVTLAVVMSVVDSLSGGDHAYFDAAVTLLFFLLIGRYLDHSMRAHARNAVDRLGRLTSRTASVRAPDGSLTATPIENIEVGDHIAITAGERFPVDGCVITGTSVLDRSMVTGESVPVPAQAGASVEAGTLNLTSPLVIEATRIADRSFLAEVARMVTAAEQGRSRYVRIADRVAQVYAPAVHLLAFTTFVAWMLWTGGEVRTATETAIAVLIVTCPCALGLAVPVAHVIGSCRLFAEGIFVRDGAAFEKLAQVNTVVFDKTGTLTLGRLHVTDVFGSRAADNALALSLAQSSNHPAARGIATHLTSVGTTPTRINDVTEVPGYGIEATYQSKRLRFGRRDWVQQIAASNTRPTEHKHTTTIVGFAREGEPIVGYALGDALRPDAKTAVDELQRAGLAIELLSGDARAPVASVAQDLGIARYRTELSPGDKLDHIANLESSGKKTLMVGDGINDAPALAAGHVSMAPSSGSDIGCHAADIVFTRDGLAAITFARTMALRVGRIVRQNFAIAVAYNCIAVPLAMLGYVTPLIAAIAMSSSSMLVVANSMRLQIGSPCNDGRKNSNRPDTTIDSSSPALLAAPIHGESAA